MKTGLHKKGTGFAILVYTVCIILTILSILPFLIMIINSTRSTSEIEQHAISLLPSKYLLSNLEALTGNTFNPFKGFVNSVIVSVSYTLLTLYFSTMTAYGLVAYQWKLRGFFTSMILCVMMIPAQVVSIGFYQFMYQIHMTNNLLALILPGIAAPTTVFFIRQFMLASLPLELLDAARIDGSGEFRNFNKIALPLMKPAIATQAIFCFVTSWNNLFMPTILLTDSDKYTMPVMVSLLKGNIYKKELGTVYLGLTLTVLPLFAVYFSLSKYIVEGVSLGSVKG